MEDNSEHEEAKKQGPSVTSSDLKYLAELNLKDSEYFGFKLTPEEKARVQRTYDLNNPETLRKWNEHLKKEIRME